MRKHHWMIVTGLLIFGGVLVTVSRVVAHEPVPTLVVSLHGEDAQPLRGATIRLTDARGSTMLAEGITDTTGHVAFGPVPVAHVRVQVSGTLADGTTLWQPGQDALGVLVFLGRPTVVLPLRSAASGLILPDPETALALELGPILTTTPQPAADEQTALAPAPPITLVAPADQRDRTLPAESLVLPSDVAMSSSTAPPLLVDDPVTEPSLAALPIWGGVLLLGCLGLGLGVTLLVHHQSRRFL
ncbi:hypothetical protein EYB53_013505 [Candidatus Chloroploca sp. M-50]|uniref:Carboxypeptidase regulatory-like domain-containing protein n=1 Tax=Candidatus Chloroploca mongolica TaxID=2528176 RepID=A0ABS4DBB1_9CHLR|nr:hypothetical protein [Candidatus Chloroploca mongolica]MBP1466727.1 hypothetical protein [Candidatus Chloroploca mongolica]